MAISILNNIASINAQNQLSITQNNLTNTLVQLSSGSRINSGADDAAGLAIANGIQANITALSQSALNANGGVGALQVADGSLAEVTQLLNRAVTLATESANGTVSDTQRTAIQTEYAAINAEITNIGTSTNYNGTPVFTSTPTSLFLSDGVSNTTIAVTTTALTAATLGLQTGTKTGPAQAAVPATQTFTFNGAGPGPAETIVLGGTTYTFQAAAAGATANAVQETGNAGQDAQNLADAINNSGGVPGTDYGTGGAANAQFSAVASGSNVTVTQKVAGTGVAGTEGGTSSGNIIVGALAGFVAATTPVVTENNTLATAQDAINTLALINSAVAQVAGLRGTIGASVNRLQAASNVITTQVQNLTSAEDGIVAANIPAVVANLSRYSILDQSGISALAQANTAQQTILTLLR
ncbi:MAG TPA: flagellin [Candidatus Acidoferrum sp.]|jgi:flagellin|nr:flagellin [Candidatus Acidoferrum sp.]